MWTPSSTVFSAIEHRLYVLSFDYRMRRVLAIFFLSAIPALAADHWIRIATPEFELFTASGEKQGRNTLRHFEQAREFFLKASPVRRSVEFPLRIIQFDTEEQYEPYR